MSAIVYFEIHYDEAERAKIFYSELFGWKVEKITSTEYYMITTQEGTNGGMMKRFNRNQRITDYFGVHSVLESSAKVEVRWEDSCAQDGSSQGRLLRVMHGYGG